MNLGRSDRLLNGCQVGRVGGQVAASPCFAKIPETAKIENSAEMALWSTNYAIGLVAWASAVPVAMLKRVEAVLQNTIFVRTSDGCPSTV